MLRHAPTPPRHRLFTITAGLVLAAPLVHAGPYSPAGGQTGSDAVSYDDPLLTAWATGVASITRGPVQISNLSAGNATFGDPSYALGSATLDPFNVVSLGDGGSITLTFDQPISDGDGWDFVVFENGFQVGTNAYFCELAFVEVSSDGVNFFRFPSVSLTDQNTQKGNYDTIDPTNLHNLAGRDPQGWGTPFDLADLDGVSPQLDIHAVTHVRIVDVVGSINASYATYDSQGHRINDPWPTAFSSSGFDLDAVGVRDRPVVVPPYTTWQAAHFSSEQLADSTVSGATADPDADGLSNLAEYALGGDPLAAASQPIPVASATGSPKVATLTFTRIADPDLIYTVEASSDLVSWASVWTSTGTDNVEGEVTVSDTDTTTLSAGGTRFLRVRIELP